MKILHTCIVIVLALFFELLILGFGMELVLGRSHGPFIDTRYRRKERIAAFNERMQHHSPTTGARLQEEMHLMRTHPNWEAIVLPILFLLANAAGIFYYVRQKHWATAIQSVPQVGG